MNIYSFDDIREAADCRTLATSLGLTVAGGRCAATWRGGSNSASVALEKDKWYDHGDGVGGGAMELVQAVRGCDLMAAQEWIGEHLHLTPKTQSRAASNSRVVQLESAGYALARRYQYCAGGRPVIEVLRYEHPTEQKEFVQYDPQRQRWTVRDVEAPLYNADAIAESSWVAVVEGEKDADALIALGWPATTCVGGAKSWHDRYSTSLAGKHVAILHDNDDAGRAHAAQVAASLIAHAASVKVICPSDAKKGDVSDYLAAGGTSQGLVDMISAAPVAEAATITTEGALATAKTANAGDYRNYIEERTEDENGREQVRKMPRHVNDLIVECHERFLGFPRRCGATLFDFNRDTGEIQSLIDHTDLIAWVEGKSKRFMDFARADARFVTPQVLHRAMLAQTERYETISYVPDYPRRENVYYALPLDMPSATPDHRYFEQLLSSFAPASDTDAVLLRAFAAAPLFYRPGIPRPIWVIDSEHGQGTGKTTLAEVVASLYGPPFAVTRREIQQDMSRIVKRLVTPAGRRARVFMIDNITGKFESGEFAAMVTASELNGIAPYGREEETRPNDLTYVVTANSATFDTDLISRSFFISLQRAQTNPRWKSDLLAFVSEHRWQILADALDILQQHDPFAGIETLTRFPEFEACVLQAMCADVGVYSDVVRHMADTGDAANADVDLARQIAEELADGIAQQQLDPDTDAVYLQSGTVNEWLSALPERPKIQHVRNLAKVGLIPQLHPGLRRWPNNGPNRSSGILWAVPTEHGFDLRENLPARGISMRRGVAQTVIY
jgi:hypothetical protein